MTPLFQWGSFGEICYWEVRNLRNMEEYMELDNSSSTIGLNIFNWTMLVVKWNNISLDYEPENINKVLNCHYNYFIIYRKCFLLFFTFY